MERRFILFLVLSFGILAGYYQLMQRLHPPRPKKPKPDVQVAEKAPEKPKTDEKTPEKPKDTKPPQPAPVVQAPAEPEKKIPEQWITLGSADRNDPYRMLVYLTNRGAALARIELNRDYYDIDKRSGYLGHLVVDPEADGKGCPVQIVGPGTPAAEAGLQPGDLIQSLDGKPVDSEAALNRLLDKTKPKQKVELSVERNGEKLTLTAKLRRQPLQVIQPEAGAPLSMLLTLEQIDDLSLKDQWARNFAIGRLSAEMKLTENEIAGLDVTDLKLADLKIHIPRKGEEQKQWTEFDEATQKALGDWLTIRGEAPGPLFWALPSGTSQERLSVDAIRKIAAQVRDEVAQSPDLGSSTIELDGVNLRRETWEVVNAQPDSVAFRRTLPQFGLEITKTYRLAKVPKESLGQGDYPAYHLEFDVAIRNLSGSSRRVAYRLDGPNGLPIEGSWYASKVSRNWGGLGLRDFIISFGGNTPGMVNTTTIVDGKQSPPFYPDQSLSYIGVDAQYFSAILMPQREKSADVWFEKLIPTYVGKVDEKNKRLANISCRLIGAEHEIPAEGVYANQFKLFAGPKKPALLANKEYQLDELVYYGWPIFAIVARPLTSLLHGFYSVTFNYGLAIILLTVLVRGLMFPLSRKQVLGAQKMQELQPEIKKIQEKYKGNVEARTKAQQELFRKHNYNPLTGCLPIFIQMPVFIGLYRALMVAIELRDAPLISNSIRWCSNLAAPDMLLNWSPFMPQFINSGQGIFGLGPYFNLLPILTIAMFIWQQKMFMPPPADEQAAMQQKIMQYMMIFMGLLFFKVASGLCIYFIASSLWGLAERQFLPKPAAANGGDAPQTRAQAKVQAKLDAAKAEAAKAKKNRVKK